jgi:hypothetical protein
LTDNELNVSPYNGPNVGYLAQINISVYLSRGRLNAVRQEATYSEPHVVNRKKRDDKTYIIDFNLGCQDINV